LAVLFLVVAAALTSMSLYAKRAVQGGWRRTADSIGEQYHPKQATSNITLTVSSNTVTESKFLTNQTVLPGQKADVIVTTTKINVENTTKTGEETLGPLGESLWE